MKEEGIYQKALADAIEQEVNANAAIKENLRRLAYIKARDLYMNCIGKDFESEELGTVKVVAVSYETGYNVTDLERVFDKALEISVAFAVDVQSILDNKRKKLTDGERKDLKRILEFRQKAERCKKFNWLTYYDIDRKDNKELKNIDEKLRERKNSLNVLEIATWSWNLTEVLAEDFIDRSMNYDGQTLYKPNKL